MNEYGSAVGVLHELSANSHGNQFVDDGVLDLGGRCYRQIVERLANMVNGIGGNSWVFCAMEAGFQRHHSDNEGLLVLGGLRIRHTCRALGSVFCLIRPCT